MAPMILIADDNSDVRRMVRSILKDTGHEMIECSDGTEAIEAFDMHLPDVVLMDINMRPMDGLTAMSEILRRHPGARVIIVSQYQDVRTRETALAMGAHAFVGKEDLMSLQEIFAERTETGREGSS